MSSGNTHDKVTLFLAPFVFFGAFVYFQHLAWIITLAFLFAGFMFNGDLDIHSNVYNRWLFLKWIWKPYQYFSHRSFWTHGPLVGTFIRLLWIGIPTAFILYFIGTISLAIPFFQKYYLESCLVALGLELGSISHTFMDWASTGFKKLI